MVRHRELHGQQSRWVFERTGYDRLKDAVVVDSAVHGGTSLSVPRRMHLTENTSEQLIRR